MGALGSPGRDMEGSPKSSAIGNALGSLHASLTEALDLARARPDDLTARELRLLSHLETTFAAFEKGTPESPGTHDPPPDPIGVSGAWKRILKEADLVAPTDTTVLVRGETGTGKEIIARRIHARSARSGGPFVAVNAAGLSSELFLSELFGHERGAFTGAHGRKPGRVERADGGTLFLDEIGDLPAEAQVALLRFLEENEFERVGGSETIHADLRVLA